MGRAAEEPMIGCGNCRAAAPMTARFCPRCGHAMTHASTTVTPALETAAQRKARFEKAVEEAIDRMRPGVRLSFAWFWLLVFGGVSLTGLLNVPQQLAYTCIWVGGFLILADVRRHVRIRERAEREVRAAMKREK